MKLSDNNNSSIIFTPGDIIAETYEVTRHLRSSGIGYLYLCRCIKDNNRLVVMKVLDTPKLAPSLAKRFRNEIALSCRIEHTNVVRIYEYINQEKFIAYTMEYVTGGDLADWIDAKHPFEVDLVLNILSQICSGIGAIHNTGIIHRDLKPENVLIDKHNHIKISDFGVSWSGATLGSKDGIVGTIKYLSPEYLKEGIFDQRSDIYSLGVVAYELITGQTPFRGNGLYETIRLMISTDPVPPQRLNKTCPQELNNITLKALARTPSERYSNVNQILTDLSKLRESTALLPGTIKKKDPLSEKSEPQKLAPNDTSFTSDSSLERHRSDTLKSAITSRRKKRLARLTSTAGIILFIACTVIIVGHQSKSTFQARRPTEKLNTSEPITLVIKPIMDKSEVTINETPKVIETKEKYTTTAEPTVKQTVSAYLPITTVAAKSQTLPKMITPKNDTSTEITHQDITPEIVIQKTIAPAIEPEYATIKTTPIEQAQEVQAQPKVDIDNR